MEPHKGLVSLDTTAQSLFSGVNINLHLCCTAAVKSCCSVHVINMCKLQVFSNYSAYMYLSSFPADTGFAVVSLLGASIMCLFK